MTTDPIPQAGSIPAASSTASVANIQKVAQLELESLRARSVIEIITERVTAAASTTAFIVGHIVWFAVWIGINTATPWHFDSFPFSFLTLVVSLEAIVLTGFILRAQGRMALLSDRRAHLDLQVNLLAEQELTAILRVVCALAERQGVDVARTEPQIPALLGETDVRGLAEEITRELDTQTPAAQT